MRGVKISDERWVRVWWMRRERDRGFMPAVAVYQIYDFQRRDSERLMRACSQQQIRGVRGEQARLREKQTGSYCTGASKKSQSFDLFFRRLGAPKVGFGYSLVIECQLIEQGRGFGRSLGTRSGRCAAGLN